MARFFAVFSRNILFLTVSGPVFAGQDPSYRWDPIAYEPFGGSISRATACELISSSSFPTRAVVGDAMLVNGDFHAFLHDGSSMIDLGTLGGPSSGAESINVFGQVVGFADFVSANGSIEPRAFLWESGFGMIDLGHLGGGRSWATGIDVYGESVCGMSYTAAGELHAFWRNPTSGALIDCGTLPGGNSSRANAVNGSVVVGSSSSGIGTRAFQWNPTTGMSDLGTLGGSMSAATGISINGFVCGWSQNSAGQIRPFTWGAVSGMTDCGSLGGSWGLAMSVNNSRQVVGASETAAGNLHAFLWDSTSSTMYDLNDWINPSLGWELQEANHITDLGFIAGTGLYNGQTRAFLLRPFKMSAIGSASHVNTFTALHTNPGEKVWFAWSLSEGSWPVPGFPSLNLDLNQPQIVGSAVDSGGKAVLQRWVPPGAQGKTVYFQATSPHKNLVSPIYQKYFW